MRSPVRLPIPSFLLLSGLVWAQRVIVPVDGGWQIEDNVAPEAIPAL